MQSRWQIAAKLLSGAGGAVACWVVFVLGIGDDFSGEFLWMLPAMLLITLLLIILHGNGKGEEQ